MLEKSRKIIAEDGGSRGCGRRGAAKQTRQGVRVQLPKVDHLTRYECRSSGGLARDEDA